jgi:hypothetical protein
LLICVATPPASCVAGGGVAAAAAAAADRTLAAPRIVIVIGCLCHLVTDADADADAAEEAVTLLRSRCAIVRAALREERDAVVVVGSVRRDPQGGVLFCVCAREGWENDDESQ